MPAQTVYDRTTCPSGETIPASGTCGSILPAENKAESATDASKTNDAIANYYLGTWELSANKKSLAFTAPNTLGMGTASVPVFRVNPKLSLEEYKNLDSLSASYVDPFSAFNGSGTNNSRELVVKNSTSIWMPNATLMKNVKNGTWTVSLSPIVGNGLDTMTGCPQTASSSYSIQNGNICDAKFGTVCPGGMIAVYNNLNETFSCQAWMTNPHRNECPYTYDQSVDDKNSILTGAPSNSTSKKTNSKGRPGCLLGYQLTSLSKSLGCKPMSSGGQTCRGGYILVPIFESGKLSFECRTNDGFGLKNCFKTVSGDIAGSAGEIKNCTDISLAPQLAETMTYPKLASKIDDKAGTQCPQQKIGGGTDEFGRTIPTIYRSTSMYILGDCRVCF